uniref:Uncharacterized protein n=1 Tax=Meloidogyne enterolobii TaxID=390850 RepID=A0A6V7V1R2_MELEN|nr:unnamed protein product [Meloidogyne enterolobii]
MRCCCCLGSRELCVQVVGICGIVGSVHHFVVVLLLVSICWQLAMLIVVVAACCFRPSIHHCFVVHHCVNVVWRYDYCFVENTHGKASILPSRTS